MPVLRWQAAHNCKQEYKLIGFEFSNAIQHCGKCGQAHIYGMNMDELIQHSKNLEEDETLKRIDDAYNRGWYDAMNNPKVNKALERLKPKKVINIRKNVFEEHLETAQPAMMWSTTMETSTTVGFVDKHWIGAKNENMGN